MVQIASCKILRKTLSPVCDNFDISTCLLLSGISLVRLRFLPHYRDKRTEPIYRVPCQASPFTTLPLGSKVFLVSCMHFCWIQVDGCSEIVNIEFLLGSTFAGFNVCFRYSLHCSSLQSSPTFHLSNCLPCFRDIRHLVFGLHLVKLFSLVKPEGESQISGSFTWQKIHPTEKTYFTSNYVLPLITFHTNICPNPVPLSGLGFFPLRPL